MQPPVLCRIREPHATRIRCAGPAEVEARGTLKRRGQATAASSPHRRRKRDIRSAYLRRHVRNFIVGKDTE